MVQPTALPMVTPRRSGGTSCVVSPLSASASRAATTPSWAARSMRRISCGDSPCALGSKSHSAAIRDRNPVASNSVMARVAVRPAVSRSQKDSTPMPPGAVTPIPVMTTRRP